MASRKASSLFSWDAENRGSERRRETLRHGQQISNVQMIAVSSLQELDLRQHVFMSNAVLEHPKLTQSLEAHFAREPIDIFD